MDPLLDTLHANFEDQDARMVLADALQAQGDPLGEWLARWAQGARPESDPEMARLRQVLLPGFSEAQRGVKLDLVHGFVRFASLRDAPGRTVARCWAELAALPLARFLSWARFYDSAGQEGPWDRGPGSASLHKVDVLDDFGAVEVAEGLPGLPRCGDLRIQARTLSLPQSLPRTLKTLRIQAQELTVAGPTTARLDWPGLAGVEIQCRPLSSAGLLHVVRITLVPSLTSVVLTGLRTNEDQQAFSEHLQRQGFTTRASAADSVVAERPSKA